MLEWTVHHSPVWGCVVADHIYPYQQPKSPTISVWASELDHEALEKGGLIFWIALWMAECVSLIRARDGTDAVWKEGNWQWLLAMFYMYRLPKHCWWLKYTPFIEMVFPHGSGLSAGWCALPHCKNGFRNSFEVLTWPPDISMQSSISGMCLEGGGKRSVSLRVHLTRL